MDSITILMVTHIYIMKHHFACFISHVFSLTCQFLPLSTRGKVQDKGFPSSFSSRILIWSLFLWRLTGLDLSSSTNSELSCEFCSCSPFPPSIGSALCLIKHVMVFHGLFLFHPSFLSHLMSFHVNFWNQESSFWKQESSLCPLSMQHPAWQASISTAVLESYK